MGLSILRTSNTDINTQGPGRMEFTESACRLFVTGHSVRLLTMNSTLGAQLLADPNEFGTSPVADMRLKRSRKMHVRLDVACSGILELCAWMYFYAPSYRIIGKSQLQGDKQRGVQVAGKPHFAGCDDSK